MRTTLTPTAINAAIRATRAGESTKAINDPITPGLNLRVGKKRTTWTWLGRDAEGRVRRFPLGRYPHVGLAEARRLAREMSHDAPRGADPIRDARAARRRTDAPTGHTLADLWRSTASRRTPPRAGPRRCERRSSACSDRTWRPRSPPCGSAICN